MFLGYGLLLASAPMTSATEVILATDILGESQTGWYDQVAFTLSFAIGVALLSTQARYIPSMLSHGFLIPGGLLLIVAGTLSYLIRFAAPEASYLTPVGSAIRGLGHSALMMGWFEAIVDADSSGQRTSCVLSLSLIAASISGACVWLFVAANLPAVAYIILIIIPITSTAMLYATFSHARKAGQPHLVHTQGISMPRSTQGVIFAFGLALGCTWAAFYTIDNNSLSLWASIAFFAMGAFMFVGVNTFMPKRELEFGAALRWCMLFTSFGFLVLPLFAERSSSVAAALLAIAWSAQVLLLSFLPIQMSAKLPANMLSVASQGGTPYAVGAALGSIAAGAAINWLPIADARSFMTAVVGFSLAVAALNFPPRNAEAVIMGLEEAPENELYVSRVKRRLDSLAEKRGLTAREREVAQLLVLGKTRGQIAEALFISDHTAKSHIRHVYEKLEVHSIRELVMLVESSGR